MPRILLVDDEPSLVSVLRPVLTAAGYEVDVATTGSDAIRDVTSEPDVLLLDLGLPDIDGKEVISAVRKTSDVPIIVISARHQEAEKIAALDEGGDDFVSKPFEIGELMARVRAAIRRRTNAREQVTRFEVADLVIDLAWRRVTLMGETIRLSPKEYALLSELAQSAGQVVTHKRLLAAGWGSGATDMQYLRVYIGLLRQKIEEDPAEPRYILTESGVGYRLADR
ncbi:MAG TPA: response regulator transcription factor [Kofleriaceae bacterium]|jgi:two-component system KDP operon response regulator KdpE|nr:response regulator transcription factor [Kofleriaceae bacterium]